MPNWKPLKNGLNLYNKLFSYNNFHCFCFNIDKNIPIIHNALKQKQHYILCANTLPIEFLGKTITNHDPIFSRNTSIKRGSWSGLFFQVQEFAINSIWDGLSQIPPKHPLHSGGQFGGIFNLNSRNSFDSFDFHGSKPSFDHSSKSNFLYLEVSWGQFWAKIASTTLPPSWT